jgi:PAS domain S-box-containing protein
MPRTGRKRQPLKAPLPIDESERLKSLREYEILDTAPEQSFDDITLLASHICKTPIALISLLDEDRQWFKSKIGMTESETSRDIAFCAHGILQPDIFLVPDTQADERFAANPLVTGNPKVRFYAGAPLTTSDGHALGMLCVNDQVPRELSNDQMDALRALSRQVVAQIELRHSLKVKDRNDEKLRASELSYRRLFEAAKDGILILDVDTGRIVDVNPFLLELLTLSRNEMLGKTVAELSPFKDIESNMIMLDRLQRNGYVRYEDLPLENSDGRYINVEFVCNVYLVGDKKVIQCNVRDITARKKAEQQLTLLNACISNLNDIIVITEADPIEKPGPKIVFVNEAFERITGYTRAEAIGRNPRFLQGEKSDRKIETEIHEALTQGRPIRRQLINYKKDGTEYWTDMDIVPVLNSTGKCTHFAAIERDITQDKKLEESLNLFRTLMERSPDAIEIIDPRTGRFLDVNETACERLGYSREEMLSLGIPDILDPVNTPFSIKASMEELRKIGFKTVEARHRRKDGATFPVEINVQYIDLNRGYLVAVVRDITDRKRDEEQIAEQATLLDKAQDAILVRDLAGRILFWNNGAERMYGWTRQEVVGLNIGKLLYTDPKKFEEANGLAIKQGEWHGELQHLRKSGGEITIEARWTLIRDNEGRPKSVLAINTDITEKKKIEAQYMRAQRMESIGTLAGGIAHDLNNILAPIMMSIDILQETATDPQAKMILETIEISAKRGSDIVRQVLSFARGIEGERVEVQSRHLLNDLEAIIKNTFPKDIRLHFSVPNDTWTIWGDPTQIHQVLLNLCVNARDAMPNGGTLKIGVENCVLDEQYVAMNREAKAGRYVNIIVTDSGTGMAQNIIDKIFEPFFTTKELSKGTGLGLSTVMAIVKSHDGIIHVFSELGNGTTFKVYLPAMEMSSEAKKNMTQAISLPRGNGETVLVVDDEASILIITNQTLQAFGYRVLTATDGAEAVAVYAQHKNEIAVVLTDMMMPIMDGASVIRALMKINPAVKIIAASGLTTNEGVPKDAGAHVNHILTKPYTAGTLLKAIRAILDEV